LNGDTSAHLPPARGVSIPVLKIVLVVVVVIVIDPAVCGGFPD